MDPKRGLGPSVSMAPMSQAGFRLPGAEPSIGRGLPRSSILATGSALQMAPSPESITELGKTGSIDSRVGRAPPL